MALSEDKKKRIESLSLEEMAYEVNLGSSSRFQRESFAYLKSCYDSKLRSDEENKRSLEEPASHEDWHKIPTGIVTLGVVIVILGAAAIWVINKYTSLGL